MNLWWEEKELSQMLANLDERYHATVTYIHRSLQDRESNIKNPNHRPPLSSMQERGADLCKREWPIFARQREQRQKPR